MSNFLFRVAFNRVFLVNFQKYLIKNNNYCIGTTTISPHQISTEGNLGKTVFFINNDLQ